MEAVIIVGLIVLIGTAWYTCYKQDERKDAHMTQRNDQRDDHEHDSNHERYKRIEGFLMWQNLKLNHLIEHAHHLEDLIIQVGNPSTDQATIQAINDKLNESKQKLKAALEASKAPLGVPPQS